MLSFVSRNLAPTEEDCPSGSWVLPGSETGWRRRRQAAQPEPESAVAVCRGESKGGAELVRAVSWVAIRGVSQGRMVAQDMEMWVVGGGEEP